MEARDRFATTHWSLVVRAHGENEDAHRALESLCQTYWFPLYAFARRSGYAQADAADLVQGYFADVVEQQLFARADSERGKLRTFLLTTFRRFLADEARRAAAVKRGGRTEFVSFEGSDAEAWYESQQLQDESPETVYDRQWAMTVMENALRKLRAHWEAGGKAEQFDAIRPFLTAPPEPNAYAEVGERLGLGMSGVKSAVSRLRGQFGEFLRAEVRETQLDSANFEEEMRALFHAFT